jgi:hypothetical protein
VMIKLDRQSTICYCENGIVNSILGVRNRHSLMCSSPSPYTNLQTYTPISEYTWSSSNIHVQSPVILEMPQPIAQLRTNRVIHVPCQKPFNLEYPLLGANLRLRACQSLR